MNAFTAKEYTAFYARVRDRDVPMAVDHLSDMLQHSVLRSADLEAERQVILEEINQHEDDPDDLVHDLFTETLWPGHPLGRPILGTKQSIRGAGRDQVRRFYRKHYVPGNVVVVAAGNLRHESLLDLVAERMDPGSVRAQGPSAWNLRTAGDAPSPSGRSLVKKRKTEQAHICIGTSGLSRTDPDRFALGVVNTALGGGMSSRLFQEIREKRGLAYSVYSYHAMYAEAGVFCAYAGTTPGRAKEVLALMRGRARGRGQQRSRSRRVRAREGSHEGLARTVARGPGWAHVAHRQVEIGHGEILTVNQLLGRIEAVTAEDAARAAERVLSQPMTVTVLGPFSSKDAIA